MDYEVGYGKPPLHTRFRKGQSGNPAGRPPRPKDLAEALLTALDAPVRRSRAKRPGTPPPTMPRAVLAGGQRRRATWREAIVAGLVERAAAGHLPATRLLIELMYRLEPQISEPEYDPAELEAARESLIDTLDCLAAEAANETPAAQPSDHPTSAAQEEP
jgi:Family of unknown function (DUF5681)